jgi:hypothetical protein
MKHLILQWSPVPATELKLTELHSMNPKRVNTTDTELIREILHISSSSWYKTANLLSLVSHALFTISILLQSRNINNSSGPI